MQNKNIVGSICTFVINEIVNNKNIHLKYFICYIIIFVIILLYLLYIYITRKSEYQNYIQFF